MLKVQVYSTKGAKMGTFSLPRQFTEKVNLKLLAQAIHVYGVQSHVGLTKTKTRAEVVKTKRKLYKQKGTGGARHGARSAPVFVGGGVAHGPRPIKRELSLPQKLAQKALLSSLSAKAQNKEIVVVNGLSKFTKTKDADNFVKKLREAMKGTKRFTIILSDENKNVGMLLRNLKNVAFIAYKNLNAYKVFLGGVLIFDKKIFEKKIKNK